MAREETKYIVIHCSQTRPSQNIGVREIDRWHRERGWLSCGYGKVIKRDGTVEQGRKEDMSGAILPINQPLITNQNSIAVGLVGGLSEDGKTLDTNFTFQQYSSLRELVKKLKTKYKVEVVGCRNAINSKSCMCFDTSAIVD